jgi:predicted peptidase
MSGVVVEIINWVEKNYRVDSDRCSLTGFSYGGSCTWAVGMQFPERFAAIVPLSARLAPAPETAPERLKDVGVWCGVGENDGDFKASCVKMNDIFVAAKHTNFHFTVVKGGAHHCYQSIYANPDFWKWLLAQKRKPKEEVPIKK